MIKKFNTQFFLIIFLFICFFSIIFLLAYISPSKFFSDTRHEGISLVRDDHELSEFYDRVSFYRHKDIPYKYSRIEYPPLAVLYLTVPAFFTSNFEQYKYALNGQNIFFSILLIVLTFQILKFLGKNKKILWLFILPSFVYYLINRFDVFPAFLVQLSLFLLLRKKFSWSFAILSLAFLAKGYALFLFPVFFVYYLNQTNQLKVNLLKNRWLWIIIGPTIVMMVIFCLLAGLENGLFPYVYQTTRGFAHGSVYVIFLNALQFILPGWLFAGLVNLGGLALTFLQMLLPLIVYIGYTIFRKYIKSAEGVISWLLLILLLYIQFSVYYSPQWFVWLLPLLVLLARNWREVILIVFYDLLNFLLFPVVWNYLGYNSVVFNIVVLLRVIILLIITFYICKRIFLQNQNKLYFTAQNIKKSYE